MIERRSPDGYDTNGVAFTKIGQELSCQEAETGLWKVDREKRLPAALAGLILDLSVKSGLPFDWSE